MNPRMAAREPNKLNYFSVLSEFQRAGRAWAKNAIKMTELGVMAILRKSARF
jgi:hypothetical protein